MRKLAILILILIVLTFSACRTTSISTLDMDATVDKTVIAKVTTTISPTNEPTQTIVSTIGPTETAIIKPKETDSTSTPEIQSSTPAPQITSSPTATVVITIPIIEVTEQPTECPTEQPTFTLKPTENPTPSPSPTLEPTDAPEYTVISSQIRSGALDGINEAREEEGYSPASLSSTLNAKAEAHAIEMAKANNLYHSSMGYIESVRSGAFIGGWAEGYGAANHATGLCLDADILNIGVGSAKSSDGTVYTCIIGTR